MADLRNLCEMFLTVLIAIEKANYPEKAHKISREAKKSIKRIIEKVKNGNSQNSQT